MSIFSEEMTCRQQNELYTKGQSSKPCGETGWGMCSNIPERPNVLPFTVSPRKDMNVLAREVQRDARGIHWLLHHHLGLKVMSLEKERGYRSGLQKVVKKTSWSLIQEQRVWLGCGYTFIKSRKNVLEKNSDMINSVGFLQEAGEQRCPNQW